MFRILVLAFVPLAIGLAACDTLDGALVGVTDKPYGVQSDPYKGATLRNPRSRSRFGSKSDRRSGSVFESKSAHRALTGTEYYAAEPADQYRISRAGQASRKSDDDIMFNFVDAEISHVVDIVLGELLGENYLIDPKVQGRVTMRTNKPLSSDLALPTLQNLLALNGVSLVKTEALWQVLPFDKALRTPGLAVSANNRDVLQGQAVHVIALDHVSTASALEVVRGQVNPGRQIFPVPDQNLFLFIGPSHEARALEDLISVVDVDRLAGRNFALVPVGSAPLPEILDNLNAVLETGTSRQVHFLPIERLSAILVISRKQSYVRRAVKWIERLDRANTGSVRQIHVYHVRNGKASELAAILGDLFSVSTTPSRKGRDTAPGLTPVSVEVEGNGGGTPAALPSIAANAKGDAAALNDDLKIIADERNNALVIRATGTEYRYIEATLGRLDIMPLQVFIEVTVAEVTLKNELEFGIEWYLSSGDLSAAFSTSPLGLVANSFPGFGFSFSGSSAKVILNALDSVTDVEVISSPKIMVLDNQSARLQVGDQVPVVTQTTEALDDADAVVVKSISNVDTGIILEVTPTVNTGGLVTLNVMQEVSEATQTSTSGIDSPSFSTRRIESYLAAQSGETVALGGLIRDRTEIGKNRVPLASRVPVLGKLFRNRKDRNDRTELIILITPYVSRDPAEARALTDELRSKISTLNGIKL